MYRMESLVIGYMRSCMVQAIYVSVYDAGKVSKR